MDPSNRRVTTSREAEFLSVVLLALVTALTVLALTVW